MAYYASHSISEPFNFHQAGIEGWATAQVSQPLRGKGVHAYAVGHQLAPVEPSGDYSRLHGSVDQSPESHFTAVIEDADGIAGTDSAQVGIDAAHFQAVHFGLKRLHRGDIAE